MRLYIFGGLILLVLAASRSPPRTPVGAEVGRDVADERGARGRVSRRSSSSQFARSGGEHELRLRPFEDILLALPPPVHRGWIAEVIGNVLLFAPFGVVLCLRGFTIRRTVGVALALSISIELVQLLLPGRTTAIDDVICNTSGAALGWFSARLLHGATPRAAGPER